MATRVSQYAWHTFLDTPPEELDYENSRFVVIPVPYDGTTSFRGGARYGPAAIIEASRHLEDYDVELGRDPSEAGIYTMPELVPDASGPKRVIEQVCDAASRAVSDGKAPVLLGGEHTITVGGVRACAQRYEDLSVLFLDAHGDLRDSFMGSRWGHASVARRVSEICPIVAVGVRSISAEEFEFVQDSRNAERVTLHSWPSSLDADALADAVSARLSPNVYVSIDLDALDPAIMSAVGTPEPGGMSWWDVIGLLRAVSRRHRIVGFDVVELSPEEGPVACSSTAARLAYKLMAYASVWLAGDQATHQRR